MSYFVLYASDDGLNIEQMDKETLEKRLDENYWGGVVISHSMLKETDPNYWGDRLIIIRGEIAVPMAEKVVT